MDNATHVKTSPNVIGEELRGKIHENETLHKQVNDRWQVEAIFVQMFHFHKGRELPTASVKYIHAMGK